MGNAWASSSDGDRETSPPSLSTHERRLLLRIARESATALLAGRAPRKITERVGGTFGGAFVTLLKGNRLRGCVGSFVPTTDIVTTLQNVTRSSLQDSRFVDFPVTSAELPALTIEISLLTSPQPTDDPASLVPGVHGIVIVCGSRSGCLLPKVAIDRNWTAEEFLANCCTMKAGLAADAWQREDAVVSLFRATVFSDRDHPNEPAIGP